MRTSTEENIFLPFNALHLSWNHLDPTEKFETLKAIAGMKTRLPSVERAMMEDKIRKKLLMTGGWSRYADYEPPGPPVTFPHPPFYSPSNPDLRRNLSRFGRHRKVYNYDPFFERNKSKSQTFLDAIGEEERFHSDREYSILKNKKPKALSRINVKANVKDDDDAGPFGSYRNNHSLTPLSISDRPRRQTAPDKKLALVGYPRHDDVTMERGSDGIYAGPLGEWQRTADNFIDSDSRKKTRKRYAGKSNCSSVKLSYSDEKLNRVREKETYDAELIIGKKKNILKRPMTNIGSISRFLSRLSPFPIGDKNNVKTSDG